MAKKINANLATSMPNSQAASGPDWTILKEMIGALDLKANSLIVTIFGDAIWPWGGKIWLGCLIDLAGSFGFTERLVRTGVYRLSQEGWLISSTQGRRAYYTFTSLGFEKFNEAQRRIYSADPLRWDGSWRLVQILPGMTQTERTTLRRELKWLGFGQISPVLLAHPSISAESVRRTLEATGLATKIFAFNALTEDFVTMETVRTMVKSAWPLQEMNAGYAEFIKRFKIIDQRLPAWKNMSEEIAFIIRILLIHDYRRLLLKDPQLPEELLPKDWCGGRARDLTTRLYRTLAKPANAYISSRFETDLLTKPALNPLYQQRFGGLPSI